MVRVLEALFKSYAPSFCSALPRSSLPKSLRKGPSVKKRCCSVFYERMADGGKVLPPSAGIGMLFVYLKGDVAFFKKGGYLIDCGHSGVDIGLFGLSSHLLGGAVNAVCILMVEFFQTIRGHVGNV